MSMAPTLPILPHDPQALTAREVPALLHLVWLGSTPPEWVLDSHARWAAAEPGLRVRLWDEDQLRAVGFGRWLDVASLYGRSPRSTCDLVRLAIVSRYGGWYLDVDMEPRAPLPRIPLIITDNGSITSRPSMLCNGAFALPPAHPLLAAVRNHAQDALTRGVRNDHAVAGPRAWRAAWDASGPLTRPPVDWRLGWRERSATYVAHMTRHGGSAPSMPSLPPAVKESR
jgi:hypothetical protein